MPGVSDRAKTSSAISKSSKFQMLFVGHGVHVANIDANAVSVQQKFDKRFAYCDAQGLLLLGCPPDNHVKRNVKEGLRLTGDEIIIESLGADL